MKIFSAMFSDMLLEETFPLPSGRGKGGAKLDVLLYGIILKLAAYVEAIGNRIAIIGLLEDEAYTAITGQEGKYGFFLFDGKEAIGPIGCPSLAKIMTYFSIGMDGLAIRKDNGLSAIWNDGEKRCIARQELAKQLPKYAKIFAERGNPFLAYENEASGPSLFDTDGEPEAAKE